MSDFIKEIAAYVQKYAPKYNIEVCSPIIAQAILESESGTSFKAKHHNYFGLKYRANRCPTSNEVFVDTSKEQKADGNYVGITDKWFGFPNMEAGVIGYFDFINIANYKNLKGVKDPETYLKNIKADGYATSIDYVKNLMAVINKYDLTQFDRNKTGTKREGSEKMGNSSLVNYTRISPNKTSPRNHAIDTITIHHMAGNLSVESCGNVFAPATRKGSSNYGIGSDGRVGLYVDEADRSWCSSSSVNDNRAITIEVANNGGAPNWPVSDEAYNKLIDLCVDICKRNGIKELNWTGDKNGNLTCHYMFAATACPGPYLKSKMPEIARMVNARLGVVEKPKAEAKEETKANASKFPYLVRITADVLNVRADAGTNFKINTSVGKGQVYTIVDEKNGWGKLKSGAGWIFLGYTTKI